MNSILKVLKIAAMAGLLLRFPAQGVAQTGDHDPAHEGILVSGTVVSASGGQALEGVKVSLNENVSVLTGKDGDFSLRVPGLTVSLLVSGQGYQQKQVALRGQRSVAVRLQEEGFRSLFENIRTEQAQPKPGSVLPQAVNAVGVGGGSMLAPETPDSYLQGRVPGLNVVRRSGTPGTGASLSLRGMTALYTGNQPLIVVDGIIYDNFSYGTSLIAGHEYNPLQSVDLRDVEQVVVVKDALTTYGTRAANGVVYINTSRAGQLATRIDFSVFGGINFRPGPLPVLGPGDYRTYLSDLLGSAGYSSSQVKTIGYLDNDPSNPEYHYYHHQTDWQRRVTRNSAVNDYFLRITGGDNIARYALSAGYTKNDGITSETGLTKYNTRFNADLNLTSRLSAVVNLAFSFNQQNLRDQGIAGKTNPISLALIKAPFLSPNVVSSTGEISPALADHDIFNVSNPAALIDHAKQLNRNYRFNSQVGIRYRLSGPLELSTVFGITYDKVRENNFIPSAGVVPDTLQSALAFSRLGSRVQRLFAVNTDSRISYRRLFGQVHDLGLALGARFSNSATEEDFALGYNSSTDDLTSVGTGVSSLRKVGGGIGKWRWLNNYFSAEYGYSGKYFVSANLSADASSRFGNNIEGAPSPGGVSLALLPSAGVAWLISSEEFLSGARFADLLKLRLSYGLVGNDNIGNYNTRNYYISQNLLGYQGLVPGNIVNNGLQWETVRKANAGIDAAFFNERLSLTADVFRHTTRNMILLEQTPQAVGIETVITNNGGLKTTGFEVSVSGRILSNRIKWDAGVVIARSVSTVTQLPSGDILTPSGDATYLSRMGEAPNLFFGYRTNGIYSSDDEAKREGLVTRNAAGTLVPFEGGDVRFEDMNGDGRIDEHDRTVIGNPNPGLTGGLQNTIAWKNWTFAALITFSAGNDLYNYTRSVLESQSGFTNQTVAVNNRWRAGGQVSSVPRASLGDPSGNSRFSDRWIEDGSYIRLRSLSVAYDLGGKGRFLKNATVYALADNLATWTRYSGYDPEFYAPGGIFSAGSDIGLEPRSASVRLGIRVGL